MLRDSSCAIDGGDEGFLRLLSPLDARSGVYYCSPSKRYRRRTPAAIRQVGEFVDWEEQQASSPIDVLPDECLFEILRRLPGKQERLSASCVSKRWLMILSSVGALEPCPESKEAGEGSVTRFLDGRETTDTRLAAVTARANCFGGLGKLLVHGGNINRVTDAGFTVVARGSPNLRYLSICNTPLVGDEALCEVGRGCPMLEKLDLCKCPLVSDKGLLAIAERCPNLTSLSIEYCPKIVNEGLQAIGRCCPKLQSISIVGCSSVGDQGVVSLIASGSLSLTRIKLQNLNITDLSLAVVGHYGRVVTNLILSGLQNVNERGFWVMGKAQGLNRLKSVAITACRGMTDVGIEAVVKGCPVLKKLFISRCCYISDDGLRAFSGAASSLENLQLEECNRITLIGILSALLNLSAKFKSLSLVKCIGVKNVASCPTPLSSCMSLRSISIRDCPGFGDSGLKMIGKLCPKLQNVELSGKLGVTDAGLFPLIDLNESGLVKVNLSGCADVVDDKAVTSLTRAHGGTLRVLNLEGCERVTDESLLEIVGNCDALEDLDVSNSAVTDYGIAALASAGQLQLHVLSLCGCSQISDMSLPFLGNASQSLRGLNLQHCNLIGKSAIQSLRKKMKWCDIIY